MNRAPLYLVNLHRQLQRVGYDHDPLHLVVTGTHTTCGAR
jgi:hypothetical protein